MLCHQAGALLMDYCGAEEIGVDLPRRLCIKVTGLKIHEEFGSAIYPHWRRQ